MNNYIKTKIISLLSIILLMTSLSSSTNAQETSADNINPSVYLNGVANKLLSEIKTNQEKLIEDTKLAEKLVRSNLLPAIDTHGFAKRTIGK